MKLAYLILPLILMTGCAGGDGVGQVDTFTKIAEIIKLTHYDQRLALEAVLGFNLDLNADGTVDAVEKDNVVVTVLALLASDPVKRDALLQLWETPRFKIWLGAVAGDIALDRVEAEIAKRQALPVSD